MIYWKLTVDRVKFLIDSNNFLKAKEEIEKGLEKFPNQINLLITATDVYRACDDFEKSLGYSELLITNHSHHAFGFVRASQDLIKLKRFDEAKKNIEKGLEKFPNQRNLLITATDLHRACGAFEKSLEYAELLITNHSHHAFGFVRASQDLIKLKRFDEAEKLITNFQGKDIVALSQIKFDLKRRKLVPKFSKIMNLVPDREYPSFSIAGNCQSNPLFKWLSQNFPYCEINKLIDYHLIKSQNEIDIWIKKAIKSDFVMMIPVQDNYRGFKFGSNYVRSLLNAKTKFLLYPNFYLEVFFPFFHYAKNQKKETIRAKDIEHLGHQYGDYHDFLAMLLSSKGKDNYERFCEKVRTFTKSKNYSSITLRKIGAESLQEFEDRYPIYSQIVKSDLRFGINYSFNHPKTSTLNQIYKIIWEKEFGLDIDDLLELKGEILERGKIPIPEFVSKSILNKGNDELSGLIFANKFSYIHEDLEDYLRKMKNCIRFYKANPEILEWNTNHKKLKSAKIYLDEIGI